MRRFKIKKKLPSDWYLEEKLKHFKQTSSEENLLKYPLLRLIDMTSQGMHNVDKIKLH